MEESQLLNFYVYSNIHSDELYVLVYKFTEMHITIYSVKDSTLNIKNGDVTKYDSSHHKMSYFQNTW